MRRRLGLGAILVCVAACAPATRIAPTATSYDMSILSRSEIRDANVTDMYDVIARLRPQYLTRRGETSFLLRAQTQVSVYVDNMRLGGIESLRGIPVASVQRVRYFNAAEATYRWGMNNSGGAIQLISSTISP